jgi:hypothetical protein
MVKHCVDISGDEHSDEETDEELCKMIKLINRAQDHWNQYKGINLRKMSSPKITAVAKELRKEHSTQSICDVTYFLIMTCLEPFQF